MTEPSALVGVLYSGEPSLPRVLHGLESQNGIVLRTIVVGHHPFAEAHQRLYRAFDERRDEHDLFVKVDADMEIVEPRLLASLGSLFRVSPALDLVLLGVDDWLSGERIMGMHAWRRGMRWRGAPSPLFADIPQTDVRNRVKFMDLPRPLVLHATEPSAAQSRRYGAQRGLKVVDTLKRSRLDRMQTFVRFVAANPEPERLLAVAGVETALIDRELADRCLFGDTRLTSEEIERFESLATDPDLCTRTLERLENLRERTTIDGSGTDRTLGGTTAGRRHGAFHRRSQKLVRRIRRRPSIDSTALFEDFRQLLG